MILVLAALVVGALVGLALGGKLRNLAEAQFRWWPLAVAGFTLQWVPVPDGWPHAHAWAVALLLVSYALLLVFVAANLRLTGIPIIAVGFVLNAAVITVNAGMPVGAAALRAASGTATSYRAEVQRLNADGGAKHHLARRGDVLLPLADELGIGRPVAGVFSVGDLFWFLGAGWTVAGAVRGVPYGARHRVGWRTVAGPPPAGRSTITPTSDGASRDPAPLLVVLPESETVSGPGIGNWAPPDPGEAPAGR